MRIRSPKLPQEAIRTLRRVPAEQWQPYRLLAAPVYVYLPKNGKFVAVKLPLQYFTSEDLGKYKPYESFYLPEFVEQIEPFKTTGESVRALLRVGSTLAQHEVDAAAIRLVGRLWSARQGGDIRVEPFFLCFFANEVCLPFPPERLSEAVEKNAGLFELAILRSSVAVFLALHVGYADASMLSAIRERIFDGTLEGAEPASGRQIGRGNYADPSSLLQRLVFEAIPDAEEPEISLERVQAILQKTGAGGTLTKKLLCRFALLSGSLAAGQTAWPSVFGEKGICDG